MHAYILKAQGDERVLYWEGFYLMHIGVLWIQLESFIKTFHDSRADRVGSMLPNIIIRANPCELLPQTEDCTLHVIL